MQKNGCKGYCFKKDNEPEAKKVCNLPECKNSKRAKELVKKTYGKLLKEIEKNLY